MEFAATKLTAYVPAYTDMFGDHKERQTEWEPQIRLHERCFVIYKRFGRFVVRELSVYEYWFTNIWGYKMSNGWCFSADDYGKTLFRKEDLENVVEICEKKNRMRKVKVIRYDGI